MARRIRAALLLPFVILATNLTSLSARADSLDLAAYRGKVVYLDFWASWCNPCRASFPWMNQMQSSLGTKGLVVIAVNVDHDRELADEFLQSNGADFKVVYDPDGQIARQYNFKDMPTSILIGRDGKIRSVHIGFFPNRENSYFSDVQALLNERAQ